MPVIPALKKYAGTGGSEVQVHPPLHTIPAFQPKIYETSTQNKRKQVNRASMSIYQRWGVKIHIFWSI